MILFCLISQKVFVNVHAFGFEVYDPIFSSSNGKSSNRYVS